MAAAMLAARLARAADPAGQGQPHECWRLLAASDVVLVGEVMAPAAPAGGESGDPYAYFDLNIRVSHVLKGDSADAGRVVIRYARQPSPPFPPWQEVERLVGAKVIALLVRVDPPGNPGLYFAG